MVRRHSSWSATSPTRDPPLEILGATYGPIRSTRECAVRCTYNPKCFGVQFTLLPKVECILLPAEVRGKGSRNGSEVAFLTYREEN